MCQSYSGPAPGRPVLEYTDVHCHDAGHREITHKRIVSDGVYNYYYDDEGNLIRRIALVAGQPTGWTRDFAWDQHNRLTSVTDRYGGPSAPVSATYTYRYDSFDRRVRATSVINFPSFSSRDEIFFYDGQDVAFTTGTPLENARYLHGAAVDEVLAREELGTTIVRWTYADHLGSVRDVLFGNFVEQHMDYTAFGVRQPGSGSWYYPDLFISVIVCFLAGEVGSD